MIMRKNGFGSVRHDPFTRSISITDSFQFGKNTIYLREIQRRSHVVGPRQRLPYTPLEADKSSRCPSASDHLNLPLY